MIIYLPKKESKKGITSQDENHEHKEPTHGPPKSLLFHLTNMSYKMGRVLLQILHIKMGSKDLYLYKNRDAKTLSRTRHQKRHTTVISLIE